MVELVTLAVFAVIDFGLDGNLKKRLDMNAQNAAGLCTI